MVGAEARDAREQMKGHQVATGVTATGDAARHRTGVGVFLGHVLLVVVGLGGLPVVLSMSVAAYEATANDGPWSLLLPPLAAMGWMLLCVGAWSLIG